MAFFNAPVHPALDIVRRAHIVSVMPEPAAGARALKTALGLALIAIGSVFATFLWISYQRAQETRRWTPVPCVIIGSKVITDHPTPNSPVAYRAGVRYRYTFEGVMREGARIRRADGPTSDKAKADAVSAHYPAGQETICFVNPAHPDFAVLEHATRAGLYTLWFPLLFVAGGAGMVWSELHAKRQNTNNKLQ